MKLKRFSGQQLKAVGDAGTAQCVFATLNVVDKDGDVTLPGAFGDQLAKILPCHDWYSIPLGKAAVKESGNEALADLAFNMEIQDARDWHSALKFDLADGRPLQEWSYGFDVLEEAYGDFNGQRVRFLKKMKVIEVSPVVLGAGQNTRTLSVKGRGRKLADQMAELQEALKDLHERVLDLKAMRAGEGRDLSKERREELLALKGQLDALGAIGIELEAIARLDPRADTEAARKLYARFLETESRQRGNLR